MAVPLHQVSFAVEAPEIEEVLDTVTGEHLPVAAVIGGDYERAIQLRLQLRTAIKADNVRYRCSLCKTPVYLVSRCDTRRFFFRHTLEDGRCTARTRGQLSQAEIDARKYNGAKESEAHLRMKAWVEQSLKTDPRFSNVRVEATWKGQLTGERRKPDVRAVLGSHEIAFEIQLSTTHLNVIAERRLFYLQEGALLFWIFKTFDADSRRLTHDDVFFNNNQNAFVVNTDTVELSLERGAFHLECIWSAPEAEGASPELERQVVSFHDLTLDFEDQRAFYYDYGGERIKRLHRTDNSLRDAFESFWSSYAGTYQDDTAIWDALRMKLRARGLDVPWLARDLPAPLLNALYSAKQGRPVGWHFHGLIEVAHRVATGYKQHLLKFRQALAAFDRGSQLEREDKSGKWRKRVKDYKGAIRSGSREYEQDSSHDALVAFLFPELENPAKSL